MWNSWRDKSRSYLSAIERAAKQECSGELALIGTVTLLSESGILSIQENQPSFLLTELRVKRVQRLVQLQC